MIRVKNHGLFSRLHSAISSKHIFSETLFKDGSMEIELSAVRFLANPMIYCMACIRVRDRNSNETHEVIFEQNEGIEKNSFFCILAHFEAIANTRKSLNKENFTRTIVNGSDQEILDYILSFQIKSEEDRSES